MKDILLYLIQQITLEPDKVSIEEKDVDGQVELLVSAGSEDIGRIIGKKGKVIKALRRVIGILALKEDKHVVITMITPPDSKTSPPREASLSPDEEDVNQ